MPYAICPVFSIVYKNRLLKLVESRGHLVYSFCYNFRRAPPEGLQNGRFGHADPLQLRQRVAVSSRVQSSGATRRRSREPLSSRHSGGMSKGRSVLATTHPTSARRRTTQDAAAVRRKIGPAV